jgi:ribosomal-protein-alanine N-acetyltransferase
MKSIENDLNTKRLLFKILAKEDIIYLEKLEKDPVVKKFFPNGAHKNTQQTELMVDRFLSYYRDNGLPCFLLFEIDSNEFVGRCGFGLLESGEIEVGYVLHEKYWGSGYASEALAELLKWAQKNINADCIVAYAPLAHAASLKVMAKCGMEYYKNDIEKTGGLECGFYRIENK